MRILITFYIFFSITHRVTGSSLPPNSIPSYLETDSTPKSQTKKFSKKIIPDNYPVTDEMFVTDSDNTGREIKSGDLFSYDKNWFRNDTLNQTLVFELYTDNFRNVIYHFKNNDIPKDLIKEIELHTEDREPANEELKEKFIHGILGSGKQISKKYFRTNKGFKLGDAKDKALREYGKPDKISKRNNIERYEWDFVGDILSDVKKNKQKKPLAKDSFGYEVTMFFRNDKLIGMILVNDVP